MLSSLLISLVLCSDVICEFPLTEMLNFHRQHQGEGTILATRVKEPSNFGVLVSDKDGRINRFVGRSEFFLVSLIRLLVK